MDTMKDSAPHAPPSTEETPHGCYEGLIFLGRLIEEDGEETEVIEAVFCRRCAGGRYVLCPVRVEIAEREGQSDLTRSSGPSLFCHNP